MRTIDKPCACVRGELHKLNLMAILSIMFVLNFRFCLLACRAANYERSTRQQLPRNCANQVRAGVELPLVGVVFEIRIGLGMVWVWVGGISAQTRLGAG